MIEVKNLTKRYGDHLAIDNLSFHVEKGKIYGFLGPNGAGKSTTMNIITGCLAATSGEVKVGGFDIFEQPKEAKKRIGFLPELPPVYLDSTIEEYLKFVAEAKSVPKKEIAAEIDRVMNVAKVAHFRKRLIKNLSKGYRQRVGIAEALIGDPEVIILDEPTVGLDPQQIIEIRDLIRSLKDEHTVILSSHILSEVQAVCQVIIIIANGKLVANDTPENLENQFAGEATIELSAAADGKTLSAAIQGLPGVKNFTMTEKDGEATARIELSDNDPKAVCRTLSEALVKAGLPILQLATKRVTLEDVFIELTNSADIGRAEEQPGTDAAAAEIMKETEAGSDESNL